MSIIITLKFKDLKNIKASGTLYGEHITIRQISKTAARKLFCSGEEVYLSPSNIYPFGPWYVICPIKLDKEQLQEDVRYNNFCIEFYSEEVNKSNNSIEDWRKNLINDDEAKLKLHKEKVINESYQFEKILNSYSYYNCSSELGKYIHFYKKLK